MTGRPESCVPPNLRVVGAMQLLLCADVEKELGPVASNNEIQTLNGSEFRGGRVQTLWMPLGSGGAVDPSQALLPRRIPLLTCPRP
jgi:hypothetical protein